MIHVLVTGGDSQLATCLKSMSKKHQTIQFTFFNKKRLDIVNYQIVKEIFAKEKFDFCINCAAYTAVDNAEFEEPIAYNINTLGVENLAKSCSKFNVKLIHISTDFVFDGGKQSPYMELDQTNPLNIYGKTKLEGELKVQEILDQYYIIRTSWLYSEYNNNFMKSMLKLAKQHKELRIVSDQIGSPTYATDLAQVIIKIICLNNNQFGVYHYSNFGETSWYGFAKAIFELSQVDIKIKPILTSEYPTPAKRPRYSVFDTTKIVSTFDLKIPNWKNSLEIALQRL